MCTLCNATPSHHLAVFVTVIERIIHNFEFVFTPDSYRDPVFYEECKQEYIKEKLEFQRTGIATKNRTQKLPASM